MLPVATTLLALGAANQQVENKKKLTVQDVTWRAAIPKVAFNNVRMRGSTGSFRVANHIPAILVSVVVANMR